MRSKFVLILTAEDSDLIISDVIYNSGFSFLSQFAVYFNDNIKNIFLFHFILYPDAGNSHSVARLISNRQSVTCAG